MLDVFKLFELTDGMPTAPKDSVIAFKSDIVRIKCTRSLSFHLTRILPVLCHTYLKPNFIATSFIET